MSSSVFSDLTLTCGGKRFKVHKIILYLQSEYFRKLLDGPFMVNQRSNLQLWEASRLTVHQESGASTIDLPDDEPSVLQVLIHYLYNFTLETDYRPRTAGVSAFLVHVYAIADKYDVPPLRSLATQRLDEACKPVQDTDDFVAVLRVVDACTAESTIWDILLPKVKANITHLLKDEGFKELVMELPALTLPMLGLLDMKTWEKACARKRKRLGVVDFTGNYDSEGMPLSKKQRWYKKALEEEEEH